MFHLLVQTPFHSHQLLGAETVKRDWNGMLDWVNGTWVGDSNLLPSCRLAILELSYNSSSHGYLTHWSTGSCDPLFAAIMAGTAGGNYSGARSDKITTADIILCKLCQSCESFVNQHQQTGRANPKHCVKTPGGLYHVLSHTTNSPAQGRKPPRLKPTGHAGRHPLASAAAPAGITLQPPPEAAGSAYVSQPEPIPDPGDQWLPKYLQEKSSVLNQSSVLNPSSPPVFSPSRSSFLWPLTDRLVCCVQEAGPHRYPLHAGPAQRAYLLPQHRTLVARGITGGAADGAGRERGTSPTPR